MACAPRCADSGTDCPGQFQARTEDELMQHVELHLKEAHLDMELTAENVEMVKGLVRTTWPSRDDWDVESKPWEHRLLRSAALRVRARPP